MTVVKLFDPPAVANSVSYAKFKISESSGVDGGSISSSTPVTRSLTKVYDPDNFASLSSNQVSLGAGTYKIIADVVANSVNHHFITWESQSGDSVSLDGNMARDGGAGNHSKSTIIDYFTLTQTTVFELKQESSGSQSGNGLGDASGIHEEIYGNLLLEKVA